MMALDDSTRLSALDRTGLLDTDPEAAYDRVTSLIKTLLGADIALVSLVDDQRQFFKSQCGIPLGHVAAHGTALSHSFCQHVVTSTAPLAVSDARSHDLVRDNLAVPDLNVIAYLGVPLRAPDGHVLGSLCAIQHTPREWTTKDRAALESFAVVVENLVAYRMTTVSAMLVAQTNRTVAEEYIHRTKNFASIAMALLTLSARGANSVPEFVSQFRGRLMAFSKASDALMPRSGKRDLRTLVAELLKPYEFSEEAMVGKGPPVQLTEREITPLCLVIHELATNSAKYGAIANGFGPHINWTANDGTVELVWTERTVRPSIEDTSRSGFGEKLMQLVAQQMNCAVERAWEGDKLTTRLRWSRADQA